MFIQRKKETRQQFLVRIALYYIDACSGIYGVEKIAPLKYDGVACDGGCLAEDLRIDIDDSE